MPNSLHKWLRCENFPWESAGTGTHSLEAPSLLMGPHWLKLCWLGRQQWHLGGVMDHQRLTDCSLIHSITPSSWHSPHPWAFLSVYNPLKFRVPLVNPPLTNGDCDHHFYQQALKLQQPNLLVRSMGSEILLFLIHLRDIFMLLYCHITVDNNNQNGYITDFQSVCNQIVLK